MEEAQAAANKRTAAIGISDSKIVVLAADDAEEPIESTTDVLAITDTHRLLRLQGYSIIRTVAAEQVAEVTHLVAMILGTSWYFLICILCINWLDNMIVLIK